MERKADEWFRQGKARRDIKSCCLLHSGMLAFARYQRKLAIALLSPDKQQDMQGSVMVWRSDCVDIPCEMGHREHVKRWDEADLLSLPPAVRAQVLQMHRDEEKTTVYRGWCWETQEIADILSVGHPQNDKKSSCIVNAKVVDLQTSKIHELQLAVDIALMISRIDTYIGKE